MCLITKFTFESSLEYSMVFSQSICISEQFFWIESIIAITGVCLEISVPYQSLYTYDTRKSYFWALLPYQYYKLLKQSFKLFIYLNFSLPTHWWRFRTSTLASGSGSNVSGPWLAFVLQNGVSGLLTVCTTISADTVSVSDEFDKFRERMLPWSPRST